MKKNIFLIICTLFFIPGVIFASNISLTGNQNTNIGESFKVLVSVDSDNIAINSIDAVVGFDSNLVDYIGFQDNDTLFKNWIQAPSVFESNKIQMTGIVPGGVSGIYNPNQKKLDDIRVVYLVFKSKKTGVANFVFHKKDILQNDGLGSPLSVESKNFSVDIKANNSPTFNYDALEAQKNTEDTLPPLPFIITFIPALETSQTNNMISFIAEDIESGIKEYRIKKGGSYEVVTSPLIVNKSLFSKKITIRAYDFNDNFTESHIQIDGIVTFWHIIILLIILFSSSLFLRKLLK